MLSPDIGTQGSKWFLIEFEKGLTRFDSLKDGQVPDELSIEECCEVVWLAVYSTHYMWEELRDYSEELNWDPNKLSQFQVIFVDYFLWLLYFIIKFQFLRLAKAEGRFPSISKQFSDDTNNNILLEDLKKTKQKIFNVRKIAISEFGVSKHYLDLKKSSIPGIGLTAIVLIAVVVLWPFRDAMGSDERTLCLFSLLYASGVSAILHGVFFMYRLLWQRKNSLRRSPI